MKNERGVSPKGHSFTLDGDGDRIFDEPTGAKWNLDGDPKKMCGLALQAAVQKHIFGCVPSWNGWYGDWCCTCPGNIHGCDSQCSRIAPPNIQEMAKAMEHNGGTPPSAACDDEVFAREVLLFRRQFKT